MTRDELVALFRVEAAAIMGVASLAEAGNGPPLSAETLPFAAYSVGTWSRIWEPTSVGLAVMDSPMQVQVTLFYVRQKAAGGESLSTIRQLLDQFAASLNGQPPAWSNGDSNVIYCRVIEYAEGSGDAYSAVVQGSDTLAAGHLVCEILFCEGSGL